jgi:hypothetical protein
VPFEPSINDKGLHADMTGLINASSAKQEPFLADCVEKTKRDFSSAL